MGHGSSLQKSAMILSKWSQLKIVKAFSISSHSQWQAVASLELVASQGAACCFRDASLPRTDWVMYQLCTTQACLQLLKYFIYLGKPNSLRIPVLRGKKREFTIGTWFLGSMQELLGETLWPPLCKRHVNDLSGFKKLMHCRENEEIDFWKHTHRRALNRFNSCHIQGKAKRWCRQCFHTDAFLKAELQVFSLRLNRTQELIWTRAAYHTQ